jgi:hypothetical protein
MLEMGEIDEARVSMLMDRLGLLLLLLSHLLFEP